MSVQKQTPSIEYECNGITKVFPINFDCHDSDHLIVKLDDIDTPIGMWALSNGSVNFYAAPQIGSKLSIQRNTPLERLTEYNSYDNSMRPQAINKDFDRIWYALQEFKFTDYLHKLSINYAIDTAEEAKKVSNAATATANAAKDTADGIEEKVKTANATANTAKSTADAATNTANNAKTTAEGIEGKVNTANSTASAAKNTADAAVVTANTAKTTADNATTTANGIDAKATQAQKDADTALSSVGGFDDRITNATIAANTANTNAAAANKTATEAKLSANNATEAVANKANKAETLAGYGIKDAVLKTDQEKINAQKMNTVDFPSALKSELNATGSAPTFACRAWVGFEGGTTPTMRANGNILSVIRNSNGDYTLNFLKAMPSDNYALFGMCSETIDNPAVPPIVVLKTTGGNPTLKTSLAVRISVKSPYTGKPSDTPFVFIGVVC